MGAATNIAATTTTNGTNSFFIPSCLSRPSCYSVINGSNVHNASVTKTTSKAVSKPIHNVATGSSGGDCNSAAVPRTPAMMTGIVTGYNRIGSSTSRVRVRTSIAANNVPTDAKPIVPSPSSATSSNGRAKNGAWKKNATMGV